MKSKALFDHLRVAVLATAVATLAACGGSSGGSDETSDAGGGSGTGGGGSTPAAVVSGTAAIGAPIVGGNVTVVCASGAPATGTTNATGDFTITLPNQTAPCALQVAGGNLPAGTAYHSVLATLAATNVANITPLTDLLVANLTGAAPATWFAGLNGTALSVVSAANVDAALVRLRTALNLTPLASVDPLRTQFTATQGNVVDDILEALQAALAARGVSYVALVTSATSPGFTLQVDLQQALAAAYSALTGGGTGGGGTGGGGTGGGGTGGGGPGGGGTGSYTLLLNVTASGMALQPISITNVPKPSTQDEFCGEVNSQTSQLSLAQFTQQGATGSLTINSCTFNGTSGTVTATLSITSPVQITIPYSVLYTYQ